MEQQKAPETYTVAHLEEHVAEHLVEQRVALRMKHSAALVSLMGARGDLRGVHALADHFDEAVRWSA